MKNLLLISIFLVLIYSCGKAQNGNFFQSHAKHLTTCPDLGSSMQGGLLAYIYQVGDPGYVERECHGIVITPTDISTSIYWHATNGENVGTTHLEIGQGLANTNTIIAAYGSEANAAKLCHDLNFNGFDDWVLPSINEWLAFGAAGNIFGLVQYGTYWTSSQYGTTNVNSAFVAMSYSISAALTNKSVLLRVRAIRYF